LSRKRKKSNKIKTDPPTKTNHLHHCLQFVEHKLFVCRTLSFSQPWLHRAFSWIEMVHLLHN